MHETIPDAFLRTEEEDIREKVEDARGLSMQDRWRLFKGLSKMSLELVKQQRDPKKAMRWEDPLPAESEELLARLRAEYRAKRG